MPDSVDPLERLRAYTAKVFVDMDPEFVVAVLEALPDAVIIADHTGRMVLVNHQAELFFGYHRAELLGQDIEMLLPEAQRDAHRQHRRGFMEEPRTRPMGIGRVLRGLHKSGRDIPLEINLSPVIVMAGMYSIAVIRRAPAT